MCQPQASAEYHRRLIDMIQQQQELMAVLNFLTISAPFAYLAAGVLRNSVWAILHAQPYPLAGTEVDVIFYDAEDVQDQTAKQLKAVLTQQFPHIEWDVTNQARVHEWYRLENGKTIAAFSSIEEALLGWPETATAIALRLSAQNKIEYIAPFGLEDLFELKLRWNANLVSYQTFAQRLQNKQWLQRWPRLEVLSKRNKKAFYRRRLFYVLLKFYKVVS